MVTVYIVVICWVHDLIQQHDTFITSQEYFVSLNLQMGDSLEVHISPQ